MTIASNTAEQLRFRVNDIPRRAVFNIVGDGLASSFELGALPGGIVSGQGAGGQPTAFVNAGGTAWSATGCTFTYLPGFVTFSGVPSAGTALQTIFYHAVFSEAQIDYITGNFAGLNGMHLEVVNALMMDASKRVAWAGGGVSYNESTVFRNLKEMRDTLQSALTTLAGPEGGFESWAENQQYDGGW